MTRPILLDTNVLIWALDDDRALTRRMRAIISSTAGAVHLSVVTAWEIAIKHQSGKLSFDVPVEEVLSRILEGTVWPVLPYSRHTSRSCSPYRCITATLLTVS